jgi:hypothetical protein
VAIYVIHAHGGNGLLSKVNNVASTTVSTTISAASAVGGRMEQTRSNILNAPGDFKAGYNSGNSGSNYQKDKLSGK